MKIWTDEDHRKLLALRASGLTRQQLAERFGVTRNAICGKLHRLSKVGDKPVPDYIGEYFVDYSLLTPEEIAKPFDGEAELYANSRPVASPPAKFPTSYRVGDRVRLKNVWVGIHLSEDHDEETRRAAWHRYWSGDGVVIANDGLFIKVGFNGDDYRWIGALTAHCVELDTTTTPKAGVGEGQ